MIPNKQSWTQNKDVWMSFVLNVTFVILLFFLGIFVGVFMTNKRLIESELLTRARSHFSNIVYMRSWNSLYGGVYVLKKKGMLSNPYLKHPDITMRDGKVYTLKNPALMTREISEIAAAKDAYHFHITSLKPLNPNNAADAFEKKSLKAFEAGEKEVFGKHEEGKSYFFRYMAPLYVEKSCLSCHSKQGYKVGDIRGGISITFNIDKVQKSLQANRVLVIVLFILTTIMLLTIIYFFIIRLNNKLAAALKKIEVLAVTDPLTELHNRRFLMKRLQEEIARSKRYHHALSCLLFDIDYFKKVNDTYGHYAGDTVLHKFSQILTTSFRNSDIIARYGGEEFIVVLPETEMQQALILAEKFRTTIDSTQLAIDNFVSLSITVSIGVSGYSSDEAKDIEGVDQIVNAADKALYKAKENGRNRVDSFHFK